MPGGQFNISGNASFEWIKFTQDPSVENSEGGVINAPLNINGIQGKLEIKNCIFEGTQSSSGGAISSTVDYGSQFSIADCQFKNCYSSGSSGAVDLTVYTAGKYSMSNIVFDSCKCVYIGGGLYISQTCPNIEINTIRFINCEAQRGGGLYLYLSGGQTTIKGASSFVGCKTSGLSFRDEGPLGGAMYLYINGDEGKFDMQGASFDSCTCSQPGNAGAIYVLKYSYSNVSITNTSFINCKTIANSSNATEGFGGAIFINTTGTTAAFSSDNHKMTGLTFTGCQSVSGAGHNMHHNLTNTINTGSIIKSNYLITDGL
ncbi:MAG: hypothetical protein EZS28_014030 [Streblomastix strix]|uniref:Right handed beta helix domain-containing protein n=1 Tax=Streblomastix strix TaxID=222440 RepID=A0A5J4W7C2_9EUKA|nr:MAG: hypothetical protein EZS28_014030 [Streblomastix strix]